MARSRGDICRFSIANHNLDLASSANLYFNGQSVDNLNITPAGGNTIYTQAGNSAATVTFGSGLTLHGGANLNNYILGDGVAVSAN